MKLNPTLVKLRDRFCIIEIIKSFCQYHTNCWEKQAENCCKGELGAVNRPYQMEEE